MVIKKINNDEIVSANITNFALEYDAVKYHTWYDNLDYVVDVILNEFNDTNFILDYSCGTGILDERLKFKGLNAKMMLVDASLKYLRLAYEKFKDDEKYYFRLLDLKKQIKDSLIEDFSGKFDGIVCANAVHLYPSIDETFKEWSELIKKGGKLIINSGNILNEKMRTPSSVLIDQTVNDIFNQSFVIVKNNKKYSKYLDKLSDNSYIQKYSELKDKYFLPIRSIDYYTDSLSKNGFVIREIKTIDIGVNVGEWYDFLKVYDAGILGWIGGVEKIAGDIATVQDLQNRLDIMKESLDVIFNNKNFKANWSYLICEKV
jgi:ubiquinone/menaquinone biosynthesis C-methylase UbiE